MKSFTCGPGLWKRSTLKRNVVVLTLCWLSSLGAIGETMLWELESNGNYVYIAGSCHMLREKDFPLPKEFNVAYSRSERVVFETSLDEMRKPEAQLLLFNKGMLRDGKTLQDKLSTHAYRAFSEHCVKKGIPVQTFQQFQPWMAAVALALLELQRAGISPENGLDYHFFARAAKDHKPTEGLVSVGEHIELISVFADELNDALVENTLEEMDRLVRIIDAVLNAWRTGDEKAMDELMSKHLRTMFPKLHQRLLIDRNKRWMSAITTIIESKQPTMIIVGSAHLVGEESVIKLLEAKGYKPKKFATP